MARKKIALIALLIAVIAVAAVFTVKRIRTELKNAPRSLVVDQKFEKIDMKSLEIFAETNNDWKGKYAPDASHRYKNPKTGEYTVVETMKCASCGQTIPEPQIPPELLPKHEPGQPRAKGVNPAMAAAMEQTLRNYKCPKCGKNAWLPPPPESKSAQPRPPRSEPPQHD